MADSAGFLDAVRDWVNTHGGRIGEYPAVEVTTVVGGDGYERGGTEDGFWSGSATLIGYRDAQGHNLCLTVEDEDEITSLWQHLMAAWPSAT